MSVLNAVNLHQIVTFIQYLISLIGILIIVSGISVAIAQYVAIIMRGHFVRDNAKINIVRLNLGRVLLLGLEFIVAADLIGTITAPDYYALGLAGIIVLIRTILSFSLNREIASITK